jgi:hypothetical protein
MRSRESSRAARASDVHVTFAAKLMKGMASAHVVFLASVVSRPHGAADLYADLTLAASRSAGDGRRVGAVG